MLAGTIRLSGHGLGDRRRLRRLTHLVQQLAMRAEATLAQALTTRGGLKAAYRFFANRAISPDGILASARPDCLLRMAAEPTVLLLQDTTTLDFTHHPGTRGLGPVAHGDRWGILVHTALAVQPTGVPLGLAAQVLWRRDPAQRGQRASRRQRPTEAKESARWAQVEVASRAGLPATTQTVTIADREADLFDLFAAPRPPQAHLLIRAAQPHRLVADGRGVLATVAAAPVWGAYRVAVHAAPGRGARTAICEVRVCTVALRQPRNRPAGTPRQAPVPLTAILVEERTPPAGVVPLRWLLLTTLAVRTFAAAAECVYWYSLRWLIERYHYVLKTGCRVEALQLGEAERLERAVAVYCLVALQVLWLTYLAREQPELPCTVALTDAEWQVLCCLTQQTTTPPAQPPSLGEAVRLVATLGGFPGRRGDGPPGPLTIWRGLDRLHDMATIWQLLHPPYAVTTCG